MKGRSVGTGMRRGTIRKGPIGVAGAGAFGTALAVALADAGREVVLWARKAEHAAEMATRRENARRLPGAPLPDRLTPTSAAADLAGCGVILLAVPTQSLRSYLETHAEALSGARLVLCCKGVELRTGRLPSEVVEEVLPGAGAAVLSGPGFAADIAAGRPTAMALASRGRGSSALQEALSTPGLRLYLNGDPAGAQVGGAVKNVIAIACGIAIGAGLGESARAATMTRGFAEMRRIAKARGGRDETLMGLSGLGDLALTCTSARSRNFAHGQALGAQELPPGDVTVEGVATARALAEAAGAQMPLTAMLAGVLEGRLALDEAVARLMSRPLRREEEDAAE